VHGFCVEIDAAVVAVTFGVELHVALGVDELAIVGGYSGGLISINTMQLTTLRVAADRDRRWLDHGDDPEQARQAFVVVVRRIGLHRRSSGTSWPRLADLSPS